MSLTHESSFFSSYHVFESHIGTKLKLYNLSSPFLVNLSTQATTAAATKVSVPLIISGSVPALKVTLLKNLDDVHTVEFDEYIYGNCVSYSLTSSNIYVHLPERIDVYSIDAQSR